MISSATSQEAAAPASGAGDLRVLMISGRSDFGGGPEHVYRLTEALKDKLTIYVSCPSDPPYWRRFVDLLGPARMLEIPARALSLRALLALRHFVLANRIDIIHAHGRAAGIFGRLTALLTGRTCLYTAHGGTPVTDLKTRVYAWVEYILSLVTARVIAVSASERDALLALCASPAKRLVTIVNGVKIPAAPADPADARRAPLRIVQGTRFVYQKHSDFLFEIAAALQAAGQLEEFQFVLLGDGPDRPAFEAAAQDRKLEHAFVLAGAVNNPEEYLMKAFCILSTSRWEGLPLTILEAMACGLPAVGTDVIGNRDAIAPGRTGFLYQPGDAAAAAGYLRQLASDEVLWRTLAAGARTRAIAEFSVNAMAEATLDLYRQAIHSHAHH